MTRSTLFNSSSVNMNATHLSYNLQLSHYFSLGFVDDGAGTTDVFIRESTAIFAAEPYNTRYRNANNWPAFSSESTPTRNNNVLPFTVASRGIT
mmetsp:Transcript_3851/g.8544  ORF Transcript_3851/g.8544 Transcript_3851/m.8544 type:complete len:94 (-) Transcript_3851:2328-2609(-)